jgi:hypothetical protein
MDLHNLELAVQQLKKTRFGVMLMASLREILEGAAETATTGDRTALLCLCRLSYNLGPKAVIDTVTAALAH